jgi:hypothetical protein
MRKRDINHQYPSGTINPLRNNLLCMVRLEWWRERERERERKKEKRGEMFFTCTNARVCVFIERRSKVIVVVGDEKPFFFIHTARTRMIIEGSVGDEKPH